MLRVEKYFISAQPAQKLDVDISDLLFEISKLVSEEKTDFTRMAGALCGIASLMVVMLRDMRNIRCLWQQTVVKFEYCCVVFGCG